MTWRDVQISEVAAVYDGPHATPKTTDEGPIFLGIDALQNGRLVLGNTRHVSEEDFATWTRRVQPKAGDLVFSYETRLGEAALIPDGLRCCLGRRLGLLRPRPEALDPHFLLYSYLSPDFQAFLASRTIHGATVDRLPLKQFASFPLSLPDLAEQKQIVGPLRALDDKIELNRRMNETLEAMAQAIFRDWFVDFGPVRRKMEGATDPVAIMGGLTPDPARAAELAMLFPSALGADGLPEGWVEGQLGDLVASVNERRKADERTREQPYVPIDCLPAHSLALEDFRSGEEAQTSLIGFMQDDILFGAMRPYFHKVVLAPFKGTTRTTVFVLRPKASSDLAFAALLASAPSTIEFATANSSGTTIPYAVWGGSMERMPVTLPPTKVRASFQTLLQPTLEKMKLSLAENRTLAETRDYLLPRLMSGQVRVGDAARKTEAMSA